MATSKIDRISIELSKKINDPVAAAATNGEVLSSAERTSYINKAMMKMFNDVWYSVGGDVEKFIAMFPEMVTPREVTLDASAQYTIDNPNLDFYTLSSAVVNGKLAAIVSKDLLLVTQYGSTQRQGSAANPVVIEADKIVRAFPAATFASKDAILLYIKAPVNPTDGSFFTQGGSYDSPFYDTWNTKIAEIAKALYSEDAGHTA